MYRSRLIIFIPVLLLLASFFACNDDFENYSTSPNDRLSFSADTIRFDTILAAVNTPVNSFMVYNKNSKPLLISSIQLKNAGGSGFKINVDGKSGNSFENVEIRANDSLYVLVDIKPNITGQNQPVIITDYIEFTTNNVRQAVVLEAYGQDVVKWRGVTIFSDSILSNEKPFLIFDSLVIEKGVSVDIQAGSVFYMHHNAEIIVKGTLRINGTLENPVLIRGDRMDEMIGIPYDRIPGQWGGIRLTATSFNNVFEQVHIRNGKYGLKLEPSEPVELKIRLKDAVLTNFKGTLIRSVNCRVIAENCEFSNSKDALLDLIGGAYSFTHCTLANYYGNVGSDLGFGSSDNQTVILSTTYLPEEEGAEPKNYAILQADFKNTIIWGLKYGSSSQLQVGKDSVAYYFENCVIPSEGAENDDVNNPNIVPTVVNCLINEDPKFKDTDPVKDDKYEFVYDFRLDSISPARNIANPEIARLLPFDIDGIDRFLDEGPDIGGYEFESNK